jgi:competence protein ComEA
VIFVKKSLTVASGLALVVSLLLNGYLYYLVQQNPEVIYLEPQLTEKAPEPEVPASVYVYVSGHVNKPGVYVLPSGSRAFLALEVAGGALEDANLAGVNLARVLMDGEQLNIYSMEQSASADPVAVGTTPTVVSDTRVNINTASQQELEKLPGIGPVKAAAIISYRTSNGAFRRPEDIMKVSGIAEKTYEGLKDFIRVN